MGPLSPSLGLWALYQNKEDTPPPNWEKSGLTPRDYEDVGHAHAPHWKDGALELTATRHSLKLKAQTQRRNLRPHSLRGQVELLMQKLTSLLLRHLSRHTTQT